MEFLASWSSDHSWARVHDDGREEFGVGIFLPPYKALERHALEIVRGRLLANRLGGWDAIWEPEEAPLWKAVESDPGMLRLEQSYIKAVGCHNRDDMRYMQWSVVWRIAADTESFGSAGWFMTPSMALAQMIALCEEHERKVRSEMIEHIGGLS